MKRLHTLTLLIFILIMSTAANIEAIASEVDTILPDATLETMPNNPDNYTLKGKAATLIWWQGNEYRDAQGNIQSVKPGDRIITVFVISRDLDSTESTSIYTMVDALEEELDGFMPDPNKPHEQISLLSSLFDGFQGRGVWRYAVQLHMKKLKI